MKKITLILFAIVLCCWQSNAQVQVGSGTLEFENAPIEPFFGFSYTQTVYLASEINASGNITGLQWFYSGTTALPNSQGIVIYMAESTRTDFTSTTDWEPIGSFTQVYSGGITVTPGVDGWATITFDTPFAYSGSNNLIVAVEENASGFDSSSDDFHNSNVATVRTISHFSDSVNADPATPPTASNIDDTIPNVIFDGITQTCPVPSALSATNITESSADLSWTENGTATIWDIEIVDITASGTPTGTPTDEDVSNPFMATGLMADNQYEYYVRADCGGGDISAWVGPFAFSTLPTCPAPSALSATNITESSADLSWTENGTATIWDIEIVDITASGTPTGTPTDEDVSNPFMATGLMANNQYEYYVRADCGGGDVSSWEGPFAFTTLCAAEIPDYIEDFTTYLNPCWSEATGPITGPDSIGSSNWTSDGFGNVGSTGSARYNIFGTNDSAWLLTPIFDLTGGGFEINLDVALTTFIGTSSATISTGDAVYMMQSLDGGTTWTTIFTWDDGNSPSNTGDNVSIDISGVTSATVQFAVLVQEDGTSGGDINFYVDNFQVRIPPSCPAPTGLTPVAAPPSDATVSWTAGGSETQWTYEYGEAPYTQGGTPLGSGTIGTTSVDLSGLVPGTTYDFYVQANCGGANDSTFSTVSWTQPFPPPANDDCADATVVSAPSTTAFDTTAATDDNGGFCGTTPAAPNVWFAYTATADGTLLVSVCNDATYDTKINVYDGGCGTLNCVGGNDDGPGCSGFTSETTVTVTSGTTYLISINGFSGATGTGNLTLDFTLSNGAELNNPAAFSYYPNPVKNTLSLNASTNNIEDVTMFNMLGQQVMQLRPNALTSDVDMSGLQTGTYFVKVTVASVTKTIRIVKQ